MGRNQEWLRLKKRFTICCKQKKQSKQKDTSEEQHVARGSRGHWRSFTRGSGLDPAAGGGAAQGVAECLVDNDADKRKVPVIEFQNIGQPLVCIVGSVKEMSNIFRKLPDFGTHF